MKNGLISRILGVFFSGFLHRISVMCLQIPFCYVFPNFIFSPKVKILQNLEFFNRYFFPYFFPQFFNRYFFPQNQYNVFVDSFLILFSQFYFFFTRSDDFAKAIAFACMEATFANSQNGLISLMLGVFSSGFLHRISIMCLQTRF